MAAAGPAAAPPAQCDDFQNHPPLPIPLPPGVPLHPGACHANREPCHRRHTGFARRRGYQVCDNCSDHTNNRLDLAAPPGLAPMPLGPAAPLHNYELLVNRINGPPFGAAGALVQTGFSPKPLTGQGPIPANTASWQYVAPAPGEYATGTMDPTRPDPPWPQFLTRVCDDCEELIQNEIHYRLNGDINMIPKELADLFQPPFISCTCHTNLGLPRPQLIHTAVAQRKIIMCYPHKVAAWNELRRKKDANDQWLRKVARGRGGLPVQADNNTLRQRVNDPGYYRACRCGKEIDHQNNNAAPECYICMACEGYVTVTGNFTLHNNPTPNTPLTGMPTIPWQQFRARYRAARYQLGKPLKRR